MTREPTKAQEAAAERLAEQYDTVIVSPPGPTGHVRLVTLDDVVPCARHEDGVKLDCPLCVFEQRARYLVDEMGAIRAGGAL